jgi:MinD-like ATPase involved in chromosome partitioning or flagellar assembly
MNPVEPEVALVLSPEAWVERFHRHCTDHGGARVRQVVMDPALALEDMYSTLVVSHRWPGLSAGLVDELHRRGRTVLGVYDPSEPGALDHLRALGVDDEISTDAEMHAFVLAVARLAPSAREHTRDDGPRQDVPPQPVSHARLIAVGGPAGSGATEVAVGIADAISAAGRRTVIVDADDVTPSIAPRLSLPIEPNIRSAIDAVEFGLGDMRRTVLSVDDADFLVLAGLPNVSAWSQVRPAEVVAVTDKLVSVVDELIVNVGHRLESVGGGRERYGITRSVLAEAGMIVAVCLATPIGISRLLAWIADARAMAPEAVVTVVVNRAPRDRYRRAELTQEIVRSFEPTGLFFLPEDRRVAAAVWEGRLVARGPFRRGVRRLAGALTGGVSRPATAVSR